MVKLTAELIMQCGQYINPVKDRELDIRGYKISVIENLGSTRDQFDCIDFSDNDIKKVDGFPLLKRIRCMLFNNNKLCRIGEAIETCLPNLEELIMTNNDMKELGDIDTLATVKSLRVISLLKNPVAMKKHYRFYVIHKLPQIKILDFRKVKLREREQAERQFRGSRGQTLLSEIGKKSKTFVPGVPLSPQIEHVDAKSKQDIDAIKTAIAKAKTLDEVERLKQLLQSGVIPGKEADVNPVQAVVDTDKQVIEEEEEDDNEQMQVVMETDAGKEWTAVV